MHADVRDRDDRADPTSADLPDQPGTLAELDTGKVADRASNMSERHHRIRQYPVGLHPPRRTRGTVARRRRSARPAARLASTQDPTCDTTRVRSWSSVIVAD